MINPEKFNRWLGASAALHGLLFATALLAPSLLSAPTDKWGSTEGSGVVSVKVVSTLPGMALPAPDITAPNATANDSPGAYQSEPAAPPEPTENAVALPARDSINKQPPPKEPARGVAPQKSAALPEPRYPLPVNAVPYGRGSQPDIAYGQQGGGPTGAQFGDASFGEKYGAYVNAVKNQIRVRWRKASGDSLVRTPTRVYVDFIIARNGSTSDIHITQRSGINTLDLLAESAVRASELPALPADYRGASVQVHFYFEYGR